MELLAEWTAMQNSSHMTILLVKCIIFLAGWRKVVRAERLPGC
jgi:hypothetical protein